MKIAINIDTKNLEAKTLRESKRLAYSMTQALNKTALAVQNAQRVNLDKKFTIRKAGFMYRLIKITFASVTGNRAFVEIYVDNTKARVLLSLFEDGGLREPAKGQHVAVPITGEAARPSFDQLVQDQFMFTALHFKRQKGSRGKGKAKSAAGVLEGLRNTFLIPNVGVFQRTGNATELIYTFKKPMKMRDVLGFVGIAEKVITDQFTKNFNEAYASKKD